MGQERLWLYQSLLALHWPVRHGRAILLASGLSSACDPRRDLHGCTLPCEETLHWPMEKPQSMVGRVATVVDHNSRGNRGCYRRDNRNRFYRRFVISRGRALMSNRRVQYHGRDIRIPHRKENLATFADEYAAPRFARALIDDEGANRAPSSNGTKSCAKRSLALGERQKVGGRSIAG
jgi:hypothetical protein